jgi:hypothetical protein
MNYKLCIPSLLLAALTTNLHGADENNDGNNSEFEIPAEYRPDIPTIDIRITIKDGSQDFIFSTRLPESIKLAAISRSCRLRFSKSGKSDLFLRGILVSTNSSPLSALTNEELNAVKSGQGFEFKSK